MSTRTGVPSSIEGIKRYAKEIAAEKPMKHMAALDEAARRSGYQNFVNAKRALTGRQKAAHEPSAPPSLAIRRPMANNEFHSRSRAEWIKTVTAVSPGSEPTVMWSTLPDILRTLTPFMGSNKNHAHFPTGGGLDFASVRVSAERDCLEFETGFSTYIGKPKRLMLEKIRADMAQSFLFLELDRLRPSGVSRHDDERLIEYRQEELYQDRSGAYTDRAEAELRSSVDALRPVNRLLDGKLMIVCKGSIWNGTAATYNGQHDQGTSSDVREAIEYIITKREELKAS